MKVTFDSNAWETVFAAEEFLPAASVRLRAAMDGGLIEGFISEAAFRIEAIQKKSRPVDFAEPHVTTTGWSLPTPPEPNLVPLLSLGPANAKHPGLPPQQLQKLKCAAEHGVRVIRALNWMGLPVPAQLSQVLDYVADSGDVRALREQRQINAFDSIRKRGVGKAAFDGAGGWSRPPQEPEKAKAFSEACAEWADGELVAAHIGYRNDVICTNDFGRSAGDSVFNSQNRAWLTETYGVRFTTIEELAKEVPA